MQIAFNFKNYQASRNSFQRKNAKLLNSRFFCVESLFIFVGSLLADITHFPMRKNLLNLFFIGEILFRCLTSVSSFQFQAQMCPQPNKHLHEQLSIL